MLQADPPNITKSIFLNTSGRQRGYQRLASAVRRVVISASSGVEISVAASEGQTTLKYAGKQAKRKVLQNEFLRNESRLGQLAEKTALPFATSASS